MANELPQAEKDRRIDHFLELADYNPDKAIAQSYLEAFDYDVQNAVEAYFAAMEDGGDGPEDHVYDNQDPTDADEEDEDDEHQPRPIPTSTSQGPAAASSSSSRPSKPMTGIRTLGDLSGGRKDDHSGDDDSDNDYFTGGEKSGLAVHGGHGNNNPQDQIQGLLDKARRFVACSSRGMLVDMISQRFTTPRRR